MSLGTFCQWLYRGRGLGLGGGRKTVPRFAEVQLPQTGTAVMEIDLPSGMRIRIQDSALLPTLSGFIRELSAC